MMHVCIANAVLRTVVPVVPSRVGWDTGMEGGCRKPPSSRFVLSGLLAEQRRVHSESRLDWQWPAASSI